MESNDEYFTIVKASEGIFKDRGSKFLGYAFPVTKEIEIKAHLNSLRKLHPSARHFCYAFRIDPKNEYWRANDDGEPSSSAGKPILGQIRSLELQNILVVVVRYFGGSLLGVPGLINAYKTAAFLALENAERKAMLITQELHLRVSYDMSGELMKWIRELRLEAMPPVTDQFFQVSLLVPSNELSRIRELAEKKIWISVVN